MYKVVEKGDNILDNDLLNNILWFNGIKNKYQYDEFIKFEFPFNFNNIDSFISKINNIKLNNQKITIIGDYDVDGICATTILSKFLTSLNISHDYLIGDRFIDGYGININLINEAIKRNSNLIITVDNGITSKDEVLYALKNQIDVIVTDHHEPNLDKIPNTLIFNPHYNQNIPFKNICGALVILSLILSYFKSDKALIKSNKDFMYELYELASLATIADAMPLKNINRKIVNQLVKDIKTNNIYNKGLESLLDIINYDSSLVTSLDIAYKIVPIFNAPGRLDKATTSVEALFNNKDQIEACIGLNKKRQQLTKDAMNNIRITNQKVNVIYIDSLHEGILGIIAGRVADMTNRPTFIFTEANEGIKGSGRSVNGFNMFMNATNVLNNNPNLALSFGGHKDAMGITLKNIEALKEFSKEINKFDTSNIQNDEYFIEYKYDSFEQSYNLIESLAPYGQDFNEPIFHMEINVKNPKIISNLHTSLYIDGKSFICFNKKIEEGIYDILFTIKKETFNNKFNYKGHIKSIYKKAT